MKRYESFNIVTLLFIVSSVAVFSACKKVNGTAPTSFSTASRSILVFTETPNVPKNLTPDTNVPIIITANAPSLTPISTLTETERQEQLINLIQHPGNCHLPCWWGLTPGISSWMDATDMLSYLGFGNALEPSRYHDIDSVSMDIGKPPLVQRLTMDNKSDVVSQIIFYVDGSDNPEGFESLWNLYSPMNILATYGKPSRVALYISTVNSSNPTGKPYEGYELWFFYNQQGFLIRYSSRGIIQNDEIHICPIFSGGEDLWTVEFYVQTPTDSTPIENMVDGYEGIKIDMLPFDVATGLSIDELMELAQGKLSCFDTPMSIWP